MNFQTLTYDMCRCYVLDSQGTIDENITNKVLGWIRARDIGRLASASDHIPGALSNLDLNRFTRQVAAFFKKNAAFANDAICSSAAEQGFEKAELLCKISNKRLDHYYLNRNRLNPDLDSDIRRVERIIRNTLGDFNVFLSGLPGEVQITSGASATRPRRVSQPHRKMTVRNLPCTPKARPYLEAIFRYYGYDRFSFKTCLSNRVVTVPKNYKTDRTIACEPEGNLSLQLALNGFIKKQLLKLGVDLSSQFLNQDLSREASINGEFSTIDLSMASDTISYNTVAWLLPNEWFKFASDIRCPYGDGFGRKYKYSKFSSMGNGSTFTIETLIFASIVKAVTKDKFAVYGDDIILRTTDLPRLYALMKFFGFKINQEKSFTEGPFRESCGTDWFEGMDVTPFYVRCTNSMKIELVHLVNGLATIGSVEGKLWYFLRNLIVAEKLPLVPFNESTISGVWIDVHTAYSKKLIKTRHPKHKWIQRFKAYVPQTSSTNVYNISCLSLWHFNARTRKTAVNMCNIPSMFWKDIKTTSIITTSVPIFTHKYRRKWVCWIPPALATPVHIYMWTDFISQSDLDTKVGA